MTSAKTPSSARAIAKGLLEDLEAMAENGLAAANRVCPDMAMTRERYIVQMRKAVYALRFMRCLVQREQTSYQLR